MRKVLEGESSLDQELAALLLKRLMDDPNPEPSRRANGESLPGLLSVREREVLGLVARIHEQADSPRAPHQREHVKARSQCHLENLSPTALKRRYGLSSWACWPGAGSNTRGDCARSRSRHKLGW